MSAADRVKQREWILFPTRWADGGLYNKWMLRCLRLLEKHSMWDRVLKVSEISTPDSLLPEVIEKVRSDEPYDTFKFGSTEEEYVKFLLDEWELFGPEGE